MSLRHRISLALEALLWLAALGLFIVLVGDIRHGVRLYLLPCGADSLHWAQGCPAKSLPWRAMFEAALIALLVWWPFIRTRIKFGYWMRNWADHPNRRFSDPR